MPKLEKTGKNAHGFNKKVHNTYRAAQRNSGARGKFLIGGPYFFPKNRLASGGGGGRRGKKVQKNFFPTNTTKIKVQKNFQIPVKSQLKHIFGTLLALCASDWLIG